MYVPGLGKRIDDDQAAEPFRMFGNVVADLRKAIAGISNGNGHCPGEPLVDADADRWLAVQHGIREQLGEDLDHVLRCVCRQTPESSSDRSNGPSSFGEDGETTTRIRGEIGR